MNVNYWLSLYIRFKNVPFHRRQSQTSLQPVRKYQLLLTQHEKSSMHLCLRLWTSLPGTNYPANRQNLLERNKMSWDKECLIWKRINLQYPVGAKLSAVTCTACRWQSPHWATGHSTTSWSPSFQTTKTQRRRNISTLRCSWVCFKFSSPGLHKEPLPP